MNYVLRSTHAHHTATQERKTRWGSSSSRPFFLGQHASARGSDEIVEARRDQLLIEHLPQVRHIAQRIHARIPRCVPIEDLIQSGTLGLMDAVKRYDPQKNVQFKYYAEFRIRGAILDFLRNEDWSSSRALRRQARRLQQARVNYRIRFGCEPDEIELAAELGITAEALQQLQQDLYRLSVTALEGAENGEQGEQAVDPCKEPNDHDPYHQTLQSEMACLLAKAMEKLPDRERIVVTLRYQKELTMREIGPVLGISESRISQIHSSALLRLRVQLAQFLETSAPEA